MTIFSQIVNGTDILEILHDYPELSNHVNSLYNCCYDDFFRSLSKFQVFRVQATLKVFNLIVWAEREFKVDRLLAPHTRYYIRELRIKAYTQLLESYRSLSLAHMAKSFGVSVEFIDK